MRAANKTGLVCSVHRLVVLRKQEGGGRSAHRCQEQQRRQWHKGMSMGIQLAVLAGAGGCLPDLLISLLWRADLYWSVGLPDECWSGHGTPILLPPIVYVAISAHRGVGGMPSSL